MTGGPVFRKARRDDVQAVVALLADDVLGRTREGADLAVYLAAFDAMQAEGHNQLIVAEQDGCVVACYQLIVMSGLSLGAAAGPRSRASVSAPNCAARASARN